MVKENVYSEKSNVPDFQIFCTKITTILFNFHTKCWKRPHSNGAPRILICSNLDLLWQTVPKRTEGCREVGRAWFQGRKMHKKKKMPPSGGSIPRRHQVGANPTETPKRLCPLTRGPHQPVFYGCPCIFKPLNLCVFFAICLAENPSNIHFIEQLGGLEGNLKENNLLLSTSFSAGTVFSGNFLDSLLATVSVVGSKRGLRPRGDWVS